MWIMEKFWIKWIKPEKYLLLLELIDIDVYQDFMRIYTWTKTHIFYRPKNAPVFNPPNSTKYRILIKFSVPKK